MAQNGPHTPGVPIVSQMAHDPDMAELIDFYVSTMPEHAEKLKACFAGKDYKTLALLAHQLRGSAGGYGFPSVGTCAGELEDVVRAAQGHEDAALASIKAQVDALVSMCRRCVARK